MFLVERLFGATSRYFETRFADQGILEGLDGIDATQPDKYLKFSTLKPLIEKYETPLALNKTACQMELQHLRNQPHAFNSASHPNVHKLNSLKNTVAASSCTPERVFSAMGRVKQSARSRLSDERTADLVLLSFEREITKDLDVTKILEKFIDAEERRVALSV